MAVAVKQRCWKCESELSDIELETSSFGGEPLCDGCRDKRYYETERGQLELLQGAHELAVEKLEEQIAALERALERAEADKAAQQRADAERISELEVELARLRERLVAWPSPRGRRSELSA